MRKFILVLLSLSIYASNSFAVTYEDIEPFAGNFRLAIEKIDGTCPKLVQVLVLASDSLTIRELNEKTGAPERGHSDFVNIDGAPIIHTVSGEVVTSKYVSKTGELVKTIENKFKIVQTLNLDEAGKYLRDKVVGPNDSSDCLYERSK